MNSKANAKGSKWNDLKNGSCQDKMLFLAVVQSLIFSVFLVILIVLGFYLGIIH